MFSLFSISVEYESFFKFLELLPRLIFFWSLINFYCTFSISSWELSNFLWNRLWKVLNLEHSFLDSSKWFSSWFFDSYWLLLKALYSALNIYILNLIGILYLANTSLIFFVIWRSFAFPLLLVLMYFYVTSTYLPLNFHVI